MSREIFAHNIQLCFEKTQHALIRTCSKNYAHAVRSTIKIAILFSTQFGCSQNNIRYNMVYIMILRIMVGVRPVVSYFTT